MNIEVLTKAMKPKGIFLSSDLSIDEKKTLYGLMQMYGASTALAYDRFFKEGFDEWELEGIDTIVQTFCKDNGIPYQIDKPLFDMIDVRLGLKEPLYHQMEAMGMCRNTVRKRFSQNDWKQWERMGIKKILYEYERLFHEKEEESAETPED